MQIYIYMQIYNLSIFLSLKHIHANTHLTAGLQIPDHEGKDLWGAIRTDHAHNLHGITMHTNGSCKMLGRSCRIWMTEKDIKQKNINYYFVQNETMHLGICILPIDMNVYLRMYTSMHEQERMHECPHIHIFVWRERERERESGHTVA